MVLCEKDLRKAEGAREWKILFPTLVKGIFSFWYASFSHQIQVPPVQTFYRLADVYRKVVLLLWHTKSVTRNPFHVHVLLQLSFTTEPSIVSLWTLLWHQENHWRLTLISRHLYFGRICCRDYKASFRGQVVHVNTDFQSLSHSYSYFC